MNFNVREFDDFVAFAREHQKQPPQREHILVGGIVGIVDFVEVVEESRSIWFEGTYGWVLHNARSLPFLPMKGQLGIFHVHASAAWREAAGL
jgi:hypothetical protein